MWWWVTWTKVQNALGVLFCYNNSYCCLMNNPWVKEKKEICKLLYLQRRRAKHTATQQQTPAIYFSSSSHPTDRQEGRQQLFSLLVWIGFLQKIFPPFPKLYALRMIFFLNEELENEKKVWYFFWLSLKNVVKNVWIFFLFTWLFTWLHIFLCNLKKKFIDCLVV